jgi:hypothetical protein
MRFGLLAVLSVEMDTIGQRITPMNDHMYTVDISAKAYDQALLFCNKRLVEKGKQTITVLPPGKCGDPMSCPCSEACGARVYTQDWFWPVSDDSNREYRHDDMPADFVEEFDDKVAKMCINDVYVLPVRIPE